MIETSTLILETQCQWFEPRRLRQMLLSVDGDGSGLDADLLDGQHGAYYLPSASYTAADVLAKLLTVDGAGSGLDADLLDGQHASSFVLKAGDTMTGSLVINGSNTISVGANTDSLHVLGRTRIGNSDLADWATFSHYNMTSISNYALMQNSSGRTALNTASGQWISHRVNNSDIMRMDATGLRIGSGTAPAYTLDVTGTVRISGNVGFFSVTPAARPAAYTQTYATATRTHAAVTSTAPSAYAAGANGYSTAAKASEVHAAVVAQQTDIANIKQVLNQVIDDLQAYGLLQ